MTLKRATTSTSRTTSLWLAVLLLGVGSVADAQSSARADGADWSMYRGDLAGTGYSSLDQITSDNASGLEVAWTYSLAPDPGDETPRPGSQVTPIVVDGVMYLPGADRVVALEPESGREIWRHRIGEGAPSRRGVAYWPGDAATEPRIIVTAGTRLIALDAATGAPVPSFGQDGEVDMVIPYNSVPLVHRHVVVVGANTPRGTIGGIGNARAFHARTGEKLWEFSSVPPPGTVGHDTWAGDSWRDRLGVNAWPFYFTVDEERGLLFLPLASPIPGAYGGDRAGDNLFGNAVVAVDLETGDYAWHFQTIHHDLWDADPPAPPVLFDIPGAERTIPALGVTTKSGYLYILDRETGEPIYGVEEREVAASDVPGEQTSATQPIPVKPAPMGRVSYSPADRVTAEDTSADHAAACAALLADMGEIYNAGPFTPWAYRAAGASPRTTLLFPGLVGGPNWGGVAFDPASRYLVVFARDVGSFGWVEATEAGAAAPYDRRGPRPNSFDVQMGDSRWPCQKPPWGRLTAVDSTTGDIVWQRALGVTDDLPADRQETGRPGRAGAIVTASGLLFIASTDDNRFRALEVESGREVWVAQLDRRGNANPMTYLGADDRQYVVIAATDTVVAYAVP